MSPSPQKYLLLLFALLGCLTLGWHVCFHMTLLRWVPLLDSDLSLSYAEMWKIQTWCPLTKDTSVPRLTYGDYGLRQSSESVSGGSTEPEPDTSEGEPMQILHLLKQFQTLNIHKKWAWRSIFPVLQYIVYSYKTDFNAALHLLNQ